MVPAIIKGNSLSGRTFKRLLVIQLGDIGDVVLSTPAFFGLAKAFPNAGITVAVRRKAKTLLEDCPWIDEVITVDKHEGPVFKRLASTVREIRRRRKAGFDLAIDLRTGTRGALTAWLSGAPRRVSFHATDEPLWRNTLFTHLASIPYELGTYVADYYFSILPAFGLSTSPGPLKLTVSPERLQKADEIRSAAGLNPLSPFVALQPFSLWAYKQLPEDHYVRLIEFIHCSFGLPVVITGGPGDCVPAQAIHNRCEKGVYNLAGKTTIGEMAALLSRSRLFIGIDSAGLHIAAAVGCPTIGVFGPSSPASWAPRGKGHRVVVPDESCVPCRKKGCEHSEISRCLMELPLEKITAAVVEQLQSNPEPN